jgi:integrase
VHDARHTAATLLIEQGVQMKDASDRMGDALWGRS